MAKQPITVKVNLDVPEMLIKLAAHENRSQGQQIEYMIRQAYSKIVTKDNDENK